MLNEKCPECGRVRSASQNTCGGCGYPFAKLVDSAAPASGDPAESSVAVRRPYYQYGLVLFMFPLAVWSVAQVLTSVWQIRFFTGLIELGFVGCIAASFLLMAWGGIDRFVVHPGLAAAPLRPSPALLAVLVIVAAVWLIIAARIAQDEPQPRPFSDFDKVRL